MREPTTPDEITPDYLMGCIRALATVIATAVKTLPSDQQESIVNDISQVHVAFEARWKNVYPDEKGTRVQEVGTSDTYGLFVAKVLD
ncbi:hypothetical protein [Acidisoma sp. L85]|uniref:hypothetical protein n=1 Tax=Acidisoma sp. L85 TaxID=1641850 RepID=UPI00131AA77F|nr:hypothetical protein [Acidisoma sp. L85]